MSVQITSLLLAVIAVMMAQEEVAPSITLIHEEAEDAQHMDIAWLKEEIWSVFLKNRVTQVRDSQEVTYHAPYLPPMEEPPPGWLHWVWEAWWYIREPWQVSYPHQFFWDSCTHAITLSHLDVNLAKKEVKSLLAAQTGDGFIPHVIWNPDRLNWLDHVLRWIYPSMRESPFLQSPSLAQAVEHIFQESADIDFVKLVLPSLKDFYSYIDQVRCRRDVLPEIIISYESGKDRSPEYDVVYGRSNEVPVWRGPMAELMLHYWRLGWDIDRIFQSNRFRVKDVLFSCIYAQNLDAMSHLYSAVGNEVASRSFTKKALKAEQAILSKMYDQESGLFYSLDARYGKDELIKVNTVSSIMPLILDTISEKQVERLVNEHLLAVDEFWTAYPVPANPLNSNVQKTEGHVVWRGKDTWLFTNWYIVNGLRKQAQRFPKHAQEYNNIADELTWRTYEMVGQEGFREYYDAMTGKGKGAYNFGPSTLVLDLAQTEPAEVS